MVSLGVGKNMVRAIRFWMQVAGMVENAPDGTYRPTTLGRAVLDPSHGRDPFLEDRQTLWLIHWNISTNAAPLFAWDYLLNRWPYPELSKSDVKRIFDREAKALDKKLSLVTLEQHFDVFLHTYVPTRANKGVVQEDNLDCPLVELQLIERIGERDLGSGKREPLYAFRKEEKSEISQGLFVYCLQDFWRKRKATEMTLTVRDIASAHGSPGQIFKLPEWDVRHRLESIEEAARGILSYRESAMEPQVVRGASFDTAHGLVLSGIYEREEVYA